MAGGRVFISYKRDHKPTRLLVVVLEGALLDAGFGVIRDVDIEPGERWPDALWTGLMECTAAVVLVSNEAAESDWCRREWSVLAAREATAGLCVVPVHLEPLGPRANILDHLQAVIRGDSLDDAVDAVVSRLGNIGDAPPTAEDYLATHRAWLAWQFASAPALGREPFSLADVYIDTECGAVTWDQLRGDRSLDPFSEDNGGREDLVERVLDYFGDPGFRDLVVVQGPAGSGKSAFSLRLATRLAEEGLSPVLVRFRDLRLSVYDDVDELLHDAIRVAPLGEHPPAPAEPLFSPAQLEKRMRFREAEISRTVIILDGWDEVTLTGSTRFKEQIERWLPTLRQRLVDGTTPVRLLLTGRPSAVVEQSRVLRRDTPVLTVRPMRPEQLRDYAARISRDADWALDLDRCEQAFTSYEAGDADVLGSPLLALLAFRTIAEWPGNPDELFAQPTALYNALIEITAAHAGKAEAGIEGTVHRGGRSLRRLLQRVASIITAQGEESVSFKELELRLEDDDALSEWADQATSGDSTLHELVVNFYFKGHPELGCEFLHKSFREYLFAESIVAALEKVSAGRSGAHPPPERTWGDDFVAGTPEHQLSRSLGALLGPQWLTPEVRSHVFWLMEQAITAEPDRWLWLRDALNDVYYWWYGGAHLRVHSERRRGREERLAPPILDMLDDLIYRDGRPWSFSPATSAIDAHLGQALLHLTAFVHVPFMNEPMVGFRYCQVGEPPAVRFRPIHSGDAPIQIARLSTANRRPQGPALAGADLRAVDLSGEDLSGARLAGADLRDANLQDVTALGLNASSPISAGLTSAAQTSPQRASRGRTSLERTCRERRSSTPTSLERTSHGRTSPAPT